MAGDGAMTITARADGGASRRPVAAHALLISDTLPDQRARAASWVDGQLAGGAKVYYKGRVGDDPSDGWLAGPGGERRAREALRTGQLEVVDFAEVIRRTDGTSAGFDALRTDEVRRGLDEGWSRVAMSQESPGLALADEAEARDYAEQEAGFDGMATRWPVTTLCQLTTVQESSAGAWEAAAVHSHGIVADRWGSWVEDGRWCLHGDLDVHVVPRFGAALHGAQRRQLREGGDPDLHVDVSAVDFLDVAGAQSLMLAARATAHRQRIVLHGARPPVRDVVVALGRPPSVHFAEGRGSW